MPTGSTYNTPHDWATASPFSPNSGDRFNRIAEDVHTLYRHTAGAASAAASADLTLSTTENDIIGASVSVTVTDTVSRLVIAVFDFDVTATNPGLCVGVLHVDGVAQASSALFSQPGLGRATVTSINFVSLAAGAHTIKLRASKSAAGGTAVARSVHTRLVVI